LLKQIKPYWIITFLLFANRVNSQCIPYNFPIDQFELPCGSNCIKPVVVIPEFKSTDNYMAKAISFKPIQSIDASFTILTSIINIANQFSSKIALPFSINFFNKNYNYFVVGNNGVISFDTTNQNCTNSPVNAIGNIAQTLPNNAGISCSTISQLNYPKASIFLFQALNPSLNTNAKIAYKVEGNAPCRKLIIVFQDVPLANVNCYNNLVTFQIGISESTGTIEVFIKNKPLCNNEKDGTSILGIQNADRTVAITPTDKNNTFWNERETAYRFLPNGGQSLIQSAVIKKNNTTVGTGTITNNTMVTFSDYCFNTPWDTLYADIIYKTVNNNSTFKISDTIFLEKSITPLQCNVTATPSKCGNYNGSIKISLPPNADTVQYTYSLNGGSFVNSSTFNNLTTGLYTVVVKSLSGTCFFTQTIFINDINPLTATAITTNTYCNSLTNGTITVTPANGTPPYLYSYNNLAFVNSNTYTNAYFGINTVTIKDAIGCTKTIQAIVDASNPFEFQLAATNASCVGVNNGIITAAITSGTGIFTYSINGFNYQNSNVFTGLYPGGYNVYVKDDKGCVKANSIFVSTNSTLTVTATSTPASCNSIANGTITAIASGGNPPYQYSINGKPYSSTNVFTNLITGSYIIRVLDNIGCETFAVCIVEANSFSFSVNVQNQTCIGNNGSIEVVNIVGAVAPYTYSINFDPFQTSNLFSNLVSGSYNIRVKDANGCISTKIVDVNQTENIQVTFVTQNPSCNGAQNGSITINSSGNYTYSINNGPVQSSNFFPNLFAGFYIIYIYDGACKKPYDVQLQNGPNIDFTTIVQNNTCSTSPNGSITINPTSGTAPFSYYSNFTLLNSNMLTNLTAGQYSIRIVDKIGCYANKTVLVANDFVNDFTVTVTNASCASATNGSIIVNANGIGPFEYILNNGLPQSNNEFKELLPGTYQVTVKFKNDCPITKIIFVGKKDNFIATTQITQAPTCNITTGTVQINTQNGNGTLTYRLLPAQSSQNSNMFTFLAPNAYIVEVTDSFNCTARANAIIEAATIPIINLDANTAACNGTSNGLISVSSYNGKPPYQYSLNGGVYTTNNAFNVSQGFYTITVNDANDCKSTLTTRVIQNTPISIDLNLSKHSGCNLNIYGEVTITAT
jgi:large repetitive protein